MCFLYFQRTLSAPGQKKARHLLLNAAGGTECLQAPGWIIVVLLDVFLDELVQHGPASGSQVLLLAQNVAQPALLVTDPVVLAQGRFDQD
jgi:hypothetical protein